MAVFSVLVAVAFAYDPAYPAPKYSKDYEYEYLSAPPEINNSQKYIKQSNNV